MSTVDRISGGIDRWLRAEAVESRAGRNSVLDDFASFRAGFLLHRDDTRNIDVRKMSGHHTRFDILAHMIDEKLLRDNYVVGKLIHHSLMFVSGGFRVQSYLMAGNQAEYRRLRFGNINESNGAAGVPIDLAVAQGLGRAASLMSGNEVDFGELRAVSIEANDAVHSERVRVYDWFQEHPERDADRIGLDEEPVQAALRSQQQGLGLATIHIAVAARLRDDDLGRVPFLEPKSISDVSSEPIYPLAV